MPDLPQISWRCSISPIHWNCEKLGSSSVLLGDGREIEYAAPEGPVALVPFDGGAVGEAPGVGRVVERAGVNQRPVHKILARIVRILIGVEHVRDRELSDGQDQAIGSLRAGELVDVGIDLLGLSAEIERLAEEGARNAGVGRCAPYLVSFAAREAGHAKGRAQTEALVDLRIGPELSASPGPKAGVEGHVPRLPGLVRNEAVGPCVGRPERRCVLLQVGRLRVVNALMELVRSIDPDEEGCPESANEYAELPTP